MTTFYVRIAFVSLATIVSLPIKVFCAPILPECQAVKKHVVDGPETE